MKRTILLPAIMLACASFSDSVTQATDVGSLFSFRIPQRKPTTTNPQRKPSVDISIPAYFYNGVLELSFQDFEYVDHGYVQVYNLEKNLETTIEIPQEAETVSIRLTDLPATYVINVSVNDQLFTGKYFFSD